VKKAGYVGLSWIAVSLAAAIGWSRFIGQVRRKERRLLADLRRRRAGRAQPEEDGLNPSV